MAIPKRFAPPNPASDALRQEIAKLPEAERRAAEANLPGGSTISLAIPQAPIAPVSTPVEGPSVAALPSTVPTMESMFSALRQFVTAQKITPTAETPAQRQINATGLTVKAHGYTVITPKGLGYLVDFGLL